MISRISAIGLRRGPQPPIPIVIPLFSWATTSPALICLFIFHLRGSSLSFAVEALALEGQFLEQRRRGEEFRPDQILVFQQGIVDGLQTDRVGIEHRATEI